MGRERHGLLARWLRAKFDKQQGDKGANILFETLEDRTVLSFGPIGTELLVNSTTTGDQRTWEQSRNAVGMDSQGNFAAVWQSNGQDGGGYGVYMQRFGAAGQKIGSETLVNNYTTGDQRAAGIAMNGSGAFVVVWQSNYQDGSGQGVYARRFAADGTAVGNEFRVSITTTNNQQFASVAMDANGDFAVTWSSFGQDGAQDGVYLRRYDSAGNALSGEVQVNVYTANYQQFSSIAMDQDGDLVVVWKSINQDGSSYGVYGRRFNSAGAAQGGEFQVNSYTTNIQHNANVAMDAGGDFVVTWSSIGQDGSGSGVYAKRYDRFGNALGAEFQVNTYTTDYQVQSSVAVDQNGAFVVVWRNNTDGDVDGVFSQRYDANGNRIGGELRVNSTTTGSQWFASTAMSSSGDFVVVWTSEGQDGSGEGVYAQRFGTYVAPTVDAGGPYFGSEGYPISLTAHGTGSIGSFEWDLDGDGQFDDALGANIAFLPPDNGAFTVFVRAVGPLGTAVDSATVTATNVAPVASIMGPTAGVRGQPLTFTFSAIDPSTVDQGGPFVFAIDWDGDNLEDQQVAGSSGMQLQHVFSQSGSYHVQIAAVDKNGEASSVASLDVVVSNWMLQADPLDSTKTNFVLGGTDGIDAYGILPNLLLTQFENSQYFAVPKAMILPSFNGQLIVYAQGGDDLILADVDTRPHEFYGGAGNDVLVGGLGSDHLDGGAGNDIVIGGSLGTDSSDTLLGGAGDDLIWGNFGGDLLYGGAGKDLLIASRLVYVDVPKAIFAIQAEWLSGRAYQAVLANLSGAGSGVRFNGNTFLIPQSTVISDGAVDQLFGEEDQDWLILDSGGDVAPDLAAGEVATWVN